MTLMLVEQRQPGFDATYDEIDGVGKCVEELGLRRFLRKLEGPTRQTESPGEGHADGRRQAGIEAECNEEGDGAEDPRWL